MSETTPIQTEVDKFHHFVTKRMGNGVANMTLEESLAEFRAYQEEVESLHAVLRESAAEARRGECGPLDLDQLKADYRADISQQEVAD